MQDTIKVLPAKGQMGFIFIFKVDFQANYFMMIEIEYTSAHFSEQLRKVIGSYQEIDQKMLSNPHYEIDFARKTVLRRFNKKYKFEAQLPFEVKKSITLKNVSIHQSLNRVESILTSDQDEEPVGQQDIPGQGSIPLSGPQGSESN